MARKSKQQAPVDSTKSIDEFGDETDDVEEEMPDVDPANVSDGAVKCRDWRDVERYKELRELRKLLDDAFDFADPRN